jgi:membrane protein DedA with SNARE-associated domain
MSGLIHSILDISSTMGYLGLVLLMAIESSFFPLPSEIVIPPAAYLASQGSMNIILVILCGTVGSVLGAIFNYILGLTLGRKAVYFLANTKIAKMLFINEKKVKDTEDYFLKYGNLSTFLGRLIPGVRHLISIPAGFSKMNFKNFLVYTFLGSFIWVTILSFLGYAFGAKQELLMAYYNEIKIAVIVLASCVIMFFAFKRIRLKKKAKNSSQPL